VKVLFALSQTEALKLRGEAAKVTPLRPASLHETSVEALPLSLTITMPSESPKSIVPSPPIDPKLSITSEGSIPLPNLNVLPFLNPRYLLFISSPIAEYPCGSDRYDSAGNRRNLSAPSAEGSEEKPV
jgi:hypothetical protein